MVTNHPRVNVTLDDGLHEMLSSLARSGKKSLSVAAKEMIEVGLSLQEDRYFSELSEKRLAKGGKNISHEDAWK
ncbi:MAG: hypothetical protein EBR02_01615 [Alphaproteobacteria bacterium]|nr:hypothetical protein [Alphaproteobacteria bacterium]